MFKKISKKHWTMLFIALLAILILFYIVPIAIPLILALITALILNPLTRYFSVKTTLNRQLSVGIIFLLFLIITGGLGFLFITLSVTQIVHFVEDVPSYINQLNRIYIDLENDFRQYSQNLPPDFVRQVTASFEENINNLTNTIKEKITLDHVAQMFSKIPEFLIAFVVYLIALFLFMLELPQLKQKFYSLLTSQTERKVRFMNERLASVFLGFLKAQFLVSLVIFGTSLVGLFIIAPDVAFVMSLIIWIIDLIPIIGSIIILGPWSLFMFLSGDIGLGIKLAILAIILLALRRIIEPKLMGQHMGLSPLVTLIAMFLGLKLIGVFGFILGPLIVIAYTSARDAGIIRWNPKI